MAGPLDKVSPKAIELAQNLGLDPSEVFGNQTYYIGLDGFLRRDARSTLEANQAYENQFSRGASGGCGQDPDRLSSKSGK